MLSLRADHTQLGQVKEGLQEEFDHFKLRYDEIDHAYLTLKKQVYKQNERYSEMLDIKTSTPCESSIELAIRATTEGLASHKEEAQQLKDLMLSLERERDEEKRFLTHKVQSVEEQLTNY